MEETSPQRSAFLTVLCILSFLGGTLGLLGALVTIGVSEMFQGMSEFSEWQNEETWFMEEENSSVSNFFTLLWENIAVMAMIRACFLIFGLIGVYQMWQLKQTGFYWYATSQVLILLIPLAFLGLNLFTAFSLLVSGFFTAIFIILYAVQLRIMQ